ncbi:putative reverse transcriptase domain-containing protein [Tanacetum coccineum]
METELWNLTAKGNDLTAYIMRFQELVMLCARMVPDEEDKVERFIGGLPDNIQRNETMRRKCMLDLSPTATSASCTMKGHLLPGHYRKDFPKLRNQNRGNKTGNKTGNNEATTKAYAIRGGGANPDTNVGTGTFLLNNYYSFMLFDSGGDRSFVSSTFSALLDVAPSTLDTSYAVELADGRISAINIILRGCTLGLLGHPFDIDLMPKIVRIPYGDEMLIIRGDDCDNETQVTSKKADDKSKEKRLEDVPIVREFPEVFPEDLP